MTDKQWDELIELFEVVKYDADKDELKRRLENVIHGQVGRSLDVSGALTALDSRLQTMTDGLIPLSVQETAQVVLDATAQADLARQILSASLNMKIPSAQEGDPGPWSFEPVALAQMLSIQRVKSELGESYQVGLNPDTLRNFLLNIAPGLARDPQNARFIFNDDTGQLDLLQPAVIGPALDVDASLQQINQQLLNGQHNVDLVLQTTNPEVTNDATAESTSAQMSNFRLWGNVLVQLSVNSWSD